MECVVRWTPHRVEPYGLELAPAVAELARQRLPHWADRIFVGNALTWQPPMRFDFVRTELLYVPEQRQQAFVQRLLEDVVTPGGRLIVCGYGSPRSAVEAHPVRQILRSYQFELELEFETAAPRVAGRSSRLPSCTPHKSTEASRRWVSRLSRKATDVDS